MTAEPSSDLLTEYVALLRAFGLPREDIRELHAEDDTPDEDAPLREFVGGRVDADSRETLFPRLVETLTQSRRGISATPSYWNYAPEVHLNEVFEPYGCSVTFRDAAHGSDGASFEIELEDASGSTHRMRFEYPETPLGDDNLPALVDAVESELLGGTDLTFRLLTPVDRRWRIVLLDEGRLAELRRQYGERVEFAGIPVLREQQPPAFVSGEATEVYPRVGETEAGTGRRRASGERGDRPDDATQRFPSLDSASPRRDADDLLSGAGGADPDAVLGEDPEEFLAGESAERSEQPSAGVEATDQDLKQVFGDLSDVSLEPTGRVDAPERSPSGDRTVIELGAGDAGDGERSVPNDDAGDGPDGLDGLFDELERTAVTQEAAARPRGDEREQSPLLVGPGGGAGPESDDVAAEQSASSAAPSGSEVSSAADRGDRADVVDDVLSTVEQDPAAVVDVTAEELFEELETAEKGEPDETPFEWVSDDELAERD